jgi:lysophospholipase L1-like esterase
MGGTTPKGGTTGLGGSGGGAPGTGGQTSTTPGTCPAIVDGPTPDATTRAKCTSGSTGITCHFGGNPGNYDVSFFLGGTAAGQTIVQAEHLRELLAAPVTTAGTAVGPIATTAGQKVRYSMSVNVRQPEGQPEWSGASNGTPGLDVYFIGPSPQLDSIAYAPAAASDIVMYILTDSTGCDQEGPGTAGWGQWLPQFFNNGISVANYGNSGALTECSAATTPCRTDAPYYSFYDDPKMWPTVKPLLKAGDVVLVEFAHNDKNTPQAQYEANLTKYITETRAAGAIPILATPIPRNNWSGGAMSAGFTNGVGTDLIAGIKKVGAANNVPVIDINAKVVAAFSAKGQATVSGYYADPTTHLNTVGANFVAELIRDEIKNQSIAPLVCYLR